jgi:hypothetical protein
MMFENLVAGSIDPELIKILHAVDAALGGVKTRLEDQLHGTDQLTSLSAELQLKALAAWRPALLDMIATLTPKTPTTTVTARRIPLEHDR